MLRRRRAPYLCSRAHVGVCWWLSLQEHDVWWQSCPKHTSKVRFRNLLKLKKSLAHAVAVQNPALCCHKFSVISLMLVWIVCAARLSFLPAGNHCSYYTESPQHWELVALVHHLFARTIWAAHKKKSLISASVKEMKLLNKRVRLIALKKN